MEGGVAPFTSGIAPSGSYILIVVSQPVTEDHKQIILDRLGKGLLSWDISSTGCDLSGLESALSSVVKERVIEGDVLIQHSTESLGVEVLLSPTVRTLKQCIKNLLSTSTCHKHLIHAGYSFAGSGSWILENGTFSYQEFLDIFKSEVPKQKRCTINLHCSEEGDWSQTNFAKDIFKNGADISLNPQPKVSSVPGSEYLIRCLNEALSPQTLPEMMKPSPLVGNIRFNRPTIYMFPAGQGDSALFGINGFNMLIDGGFHRKPCSWDFVRHLDRLDAVLVTRITESNVCGISTLMKRNALNNANPQIGYVFCNVSETKPVPSKEEQKVSKDDLIISVVEEGHNFVQTLNDFKLKPHQCWRDSTIDPFVLYHKVGQGTLEMHVLSPPRDSKEMKQFLSEWNAYKETFSCVKSGLKDRENESNIPLSHATSICAILVWRPEDPKDTITRILFPGSAPQNKILEGLEKLKALNILNQPVVTKSTLTSTQTTKQVVSKVEKTVVNKAAIPNRNHTASPALSMSSVASRNGDINGIKKEKEIKKIVKDVKKEVKKEIKKEIKKDTTAKESKKETKTDSIIKKETILKKEVDKEVKKDVKEIKKIIKKDTKDIKSSVDKKNETKPTPKKETTPTTKNSDVKKVSSTIKKSTTPTAATKKETVKSTATAKVTDIRKSSASKPVESKLTKDISSKKTPDTKTVAKTKPKSTSTTPKSTPKTKPVAVPKPGSKMTKAVAASSIVASAVAVTAAAVELNEKKEVIEDNEPEVIPEKVPEKEDTVVASDVVANEKPAEEAVSPLPPEALSPTPSESVSLTPSDTLSSAPLETVSPTPPLANEPTSVEERDIRDIDHDIPFETDPIEEAGMPEIENIETGDEHEINDIAEQLAKCQASSNVMSTSFIDQKEFENIESAVLAQAQQETEFVQKEYESTFAASDTTESRPTTEKHILVEEETIEKDLIHDLHAIQDDEKVHDAESNAVENYADDIAHQVSAENDICKPTDGSNEKKLLDEAISDNQFGDQEEKEKKFDNLKEASNIEYLEKEFTEEKQFNSDKFSDKDGVMEQLSEERNVKESDQIEITEETNITKGFSSEREEFDMENYAVESGMNVATEYDHRDENLDENAHVAEKYELDLQTKESTSLNIESKDTVVEENCNEKDSEPIQEEKINIIDSQLAGLSMEGSFCTSTDGKEIISASETEYVPDSRLETNAKDDDHFNEEVGSNVNADHEEFEQKSYPMNEDIGSYNTDLESVSENFLNQTELTFVTESREAHQEIVQESYEIHAESNNDENTTTVEVHAADQKDRLSQIMSMEESFHQDNFDYANPSDIVGDDEMQETSVDEPEEIIRKESSVSITLNEENIEEAYLESCRRKSGTESEDDVDIGKYMIKEHVDQDKLSAQPQSDSDDEDVVKSPTPHAVVDYEGQSDESQELHIGANEDNIQHDKEMRSVEKHDFDEKDRDSAEDQEVDDGEMIRHPTPPHMKFSEEEMRDPIGQHIITHPNLNQSPGIAEEPLYEEEDESDRSVSPVVEQPVYINTAEANYPELVTVSGGTTPSEPQSPKSNFDSKKLVTDAAVMEALSEHDASESYSPSCQDGSTAFDLQASEKSALDAQSLQDIPHDDNLKKIESKAENPESENVDDDKVLSSEVTKHDEDDDKKDEKQESPSDEESSSDNENSESHSKDKSDALGDKSDNEQDDKSDVHNDDKSDPHFDSKSDVVDDENEDKHDTTGHLHTQHEYGMKQYSEYQENSETIETNKLEISDGDYLKYESQISQDLQDTNFHGEYQSSEEITHKEFDAGPNNFETKPSNYETADFHEKFPDVSHDLSCSNIEQSDMLDKDLYSQHDDLYTSSDPQCIKSCDQVVESEVSPSLLITESVKEGSSTLIENNYIENDNGENSASFRQTGTDFENSQPVGDIRGTYSSFTKNEIEATTVTDVIVVDGSQEITYGKINSEKDSFDEYGAISNHAENKEILQHVPTSFESKTSEINNFEISRLEETSHLSHEVHYESSLLEKFSDDLDRPSRFDTNVEDSNITYDISNLQPSADVSANSETASQEFDISTPHRDLPPSQLIDDIRYENSQMDFTLEHKYKNADFKEFDSLGDSSLPSVQEQFTDSKTHFMETYSEKEILSSSGLENKNEIDSGIYNESCNEEIIEDASLDPPGYSTMNGKGEVAFNLPPTAFVPEQFEDSGITNTEVTSICDQQQNASYVVDNRFHSDSPEDRTMRSDSSPDVPYPAELPGKFLDGDTQLLQDPNSDGFVPPPPVTDYENMNYPHSDDISASPKSNINDNSEIPYPEFQADDQSARTINNLATFAYTNKAYAREEEDLDGNHIYKEETAELSKQVEFDGNNLHALSTHQVSSVMNYSQEYQDTHYPAETNYDFRLEEWGKPMGLPTPPDGAQKVLAKKSDKPIKSKTVDTNGKVPSVASKVSSPKKPKPKVSKESSSSPVYVDLAYVPQHGDPEYCDVEFFKKIRARYYVFSSVNPSKEVLNALLEAKKTWNEDLSVTIIPTYETDTLGYWVAQHQDDLAEYSIDISPSASRCTVNLQDHQTSCSAYRLEF